MLKSAELRALVILRMMEQGLTETKRHVRPFELIRDERISQEWDRLEIWREYPFKSISAPQLYLALGLLADMGMVEDFSAVKTYARAHKMSVGMLHVLAFVMFRGLVNWGEIGDHFDTHLSEIDAVMNRLKNGRWITSMPNGSTSLWQPTDKARALQPEIFTLGDLYKQVDWDLSYWINDTGIAFAQMLSNDWRHWALPEAVRP